MGDETQLIRNTQANLITLQAARIALLEARLAIAQKTIERLQDEKKSARVQPVKGVQA